MELCAFMFKKFFILLILPFCIATGQFIQPNAGDSKKMSPGTKLFLTYGNDVSLFPRIQANYVAALVQVSNEQLPLTQAVQLVSDFGKIKSVWLDSAGMIALLADENVEYVDLAWRCNASRKLNDTARILSNVDAVQFGASNGLNMNYLGTNVITGIVDVGFQSDNPTFYSGDGSTYRVKRWWHQSNNSGQKPAGYNYGTEFSAVSDILSARDDDGTHGTHVAGIASGSGYTTPALKYRGMAPDADLVFVTIKYSNDTLSGSGLGDYVVANPTILDGFKYVYDYAKSVGKPAVCNLSWGMHTGPHDGNSLFDKAVENMTGSGKILVGSAGNEANNQMHIGGNLQNDTLYTFAIDRNRGNYKHENVMVDCWGDVGEKMALNVSLLDTLGNIILESPFVSSQGIAMYKKVFAHGADTLWLTVTQNSSFVNNGKPEILLIAESNDASYQRIRLGITGKGAFHAWNSGQAYRWTSGGFLDKVRGNDYSGVYLNGNSVSSVGENGGSGKSTITVGSYVARNNWIDFNGQYHAQNWLNVGAISDFSSRGPSVDGRIKPDIGAPGQNIASSVNYRTFAGWMGENSPYKSSFGGNDQYWTLLSGTSMAGPHVTGIVALLLQLNPSLSPNQVRDIIQSTALRDSYTGPDSNFIFGYGKINALEAMKKLVKLSKLSQYSIADTKVFPNPSNGVEVFLSNPYFEGETCSVEIINLTGSLIREQALTFDDLGIGKLNLNDITPGIVIIRIANQTEVWTEMLRVRP